MIVRNTKLNSSIRKTYRGELTDSNVKVPKGRPSSMKEEAPISLTTVYETLDGEPWKPEYGMPDYEDVFQGF